MEISIMNSTTKKKKEKKNWNKRNYIDSNIQ